jgi:pimeloyl-ACP methyl ester carboxylesterase
MGRSGKPAIGYRFGDHARYLDAWFDALKLDGVVLTGHDWGGALAFDWAARHPGRVRGIAFMETIIKPMAWDDFAPGARDRFRARRAPGTGEKIVLEQNASIEAGLAGSIMSGLSEHDHDVYRAPYPTPESRRPLLEWPRAMPLDGEPADVAARVAAYDQWLTTSPGVPKLLLTFDSAAVAQHGHVHRLHTAKGARAPSHARPARAAGADRRAWAVSAAGLARGPGPDFSERDRALLVLLRPHLHQAYLDAERRRHPVPRLTPRQQDLLRLLAAGLDPALVQLSRSVPNGLTVRFVPGSRTSLVTEQARTESLG